MELRGWIESGGRILPEPEIADLPPEKLAVCGGEFTLRTGSLTARDRYGIMPGSIPAGRVLTKTGELTIFPEVPALSLNDAIREAVRLRVEAASSGKAVVTLSGGVDSTLIAVLAGLPCIAVGMEGSHDLTAAVSAADRLGLTLRAGTITEDDLVEALPHLLRVLPRRTPMDIEIGLTGYFVGQTARAAGADRILTGQAADELFGGYARYGRSTGLRADLDRDFLGLAAQRERDAAAVTAAASGLWYSMPYMDERVIAASRKYRDEELVAGELRKIALRTVAETYLPADIAWKAKKAMQYGSGISAALRKLAKKNGCSDIGAYADRVVPGEDHFP